MTVLVPIGEFSKMTHLSLEALRGCHEAGLLEPASTEAASGDPRYSPDQVPVAQVIRRLRDLGLPLEAVRPVVEAPDGASRDAALVALLEPIRQRSEATQQTVASLRAILAGTPATGDVQLRSLPAAWVLSIADTVAQQDGRAWLEAAFAELHEAARTSGLAETGPDGALYDEDHFLEAEGRVTAVVPVDADDRALTAGTGRTTLLELPAGDHAVLSHRGPVEELDRTYGALGTWVAGRGIAGSGPLRETYVGDDRTEVAWPVVSRG